jgi:hypothetical protein
MYLENIFENSPLLKILAEVGDKLPKKLNDPWRNSYYSLFLEEQKQLGEASKYKKYIENLPTNSESYPCLWKDLKDLEEAEYAKTVISKN